MLYRQNIASLDCRLKELDETRNLCLEKKKKDNGLMSNKHIKFCKALNYIELFLIFISAASVCISISVFVLLVGIPISITSSAVGLQICAIPAVTKKY